MTYNSRLIFKKDQDFLLVKEVLEKQRLAWNEASKTRFSLLRTQNNSIIHLHRAFYHDFRRKNPNIPSQVVICAEREVLSSYKSIKSNKNQHKIKQAITKKKLSLRLDKRIYTWKNGVFKITTLQGRVACSLQMYPKLQELLTKYFFCDPLIFEKNGEIWISLAFKVPELPVLQDNPKIIGLDLGIRNFVATSESKLYKDKGFNARKRRLRFLKRCLQSKKTKSAKRHLKQLKKKEFFSNRDFTRKLVNKVIKETQADIFVIEKLNLKKLKSKQHKYQNKNRISQVNFGLFSTLLKQKALLLQKQVVTVNPAYTSQIDHRTGKIGNRLNGKFIGNDGKFLNADINAAKNILQRGLIKLPTSVNFSGQAAVNRPIVGNVSQETN